MAGVPCPGCNGHLTDGECPKCGHVETLRPFARPPHPPGDDRFQHSRPDRRAWHGLSDEELRQGREGLARARLALRMGADRKLDRKHGRAAA